MHTRWIALGVAPLAALAISAAPALGGGAISKQKAPTKAQKAAIMKAAKVKGPARCYTAQLSARKQTIAGFKFNTKAKNCTRYGFDGAALYFGSPNKKAWYLLEAGSALDPENCDAVQALIGNAAWQDMIPYISVMGCQNFD
jgi:hypothetical protein